MTFMLARRIQLHVEQDNAFRQKGMLVQFLLKLYIKLSVVFRFISARYVKKGVYD